MVDAASGKYSNAYLKASGILEYHPSFLFEENLSELQKLEPHGKSLNAPTGTFILMSAADLQAPCCGH